MIFPKMVTVVQIKSIVFIKAYKKVEKLSETMNSEEIANVLGKSMVNEYIRILNEE